MSSTSVHLPPILVERLDRLACAERVSRNRLIVLACEEFLERRGGEWPEGFFESPPLSQEDLAELRAAGDDMEQAILAARQNRAGLAF